MSKPNVKPAEEGNAGRMRLARYLARCGVASRRQSEPIILDGRVSVNGEIITNVAHTVDPDTDEISVDGKLLGMTQKHVHLVFHKPRRLIVSRSDEKDRRTVYDMLPIDFESISDRLIYIGRLDYMSEGLLIMTTDGDLVQKVSHPSNGCEKVYRVTTETALDADQLMALREGITDEDELLELKSIELNEPRPDKPPSYNLVLGAGKNRQIRRMFNHIDMTILRLQRISIGPVKLQGMPPREWRFLTKAEVRELMGNA